MCAVSGPPWRRLVRYAPEKYTHFLDVIANVPLVVKFGVYAPQTLEHGLALLPFVYGAVKDEVGFIFNCAITHGVACSACAHA